MDIRWATCGRSKHPAIYVVRGNYDSLGYSLGTFLDEVGLIGEVVVIEQYPTASEAKENAGSRKHAFSWGRFSIFGASELVKEIQSRL
jgi:hypothetical protein